MARQSASGEPKDAAVNFRTSRRLRDVLEKSAQAENRSLAQEIEARLLKSMELTEQPDEKWDYPTKAHARIVGKCLDHISMISGKSWIWTRAGRDAARAAVLKVFEAADVLAAMDEEAGDQKSAAELTNSAVAVAKYLTFQIDFNAYVEESEGAGSKRTSQ